MEPLTIQQEVSLVSDEQDDNIKGGNADGNAKLEDSSLEGRTGTNKDCSSSPEFDETPSESGVDNDSDCGASAVQDVEYTSKGTDAVKVASIQEGLQHEPAFDNTSVSPETGTVSLNSPESENFDDTFEASRFNDVDSDSSIGKPDLSSELIENPFHVKSTNLLDSEPNPSEFNSDPQDEMHGSSGLQNFNLSLDSAIHIDNEPVALKISIDSQPKATLENQDSPNNDIEPVAPSSAKENLDLNETPQVLAEKNNTSPYVLNYSEKASFATSLSVSAYPFANEKNENHHDEVHRSRSELPKPGNLFSSAGIPAPSVVSAALQVLPGKVLVPAVVDQTQGQALAALQVLKVPLCPHYMCIRLHYFEASKRLSCISKVEFLSYLFSC